MTIKVSEVAKHILNGNDEKFKALGGRNVSKVVRSSFQKVLTELDSVDEGKVRFAGLGVFIIKQVEVEQEDGTKTKKKSIRFRPAAEK